MIKLYDIVPYKTNIKGYWLDNGKVYIDNVRIVYMHTDIRLYWEKHFLFNTRKQLAVFYIKGDKAYIEDRQGNVIILKHCIKFNEKRITKEYLKALLLQHGGLTIFKCKDYYIIEIWK